MGSQFVDQIGPGGVLLAAPDATLTSRQKDDLLLAALPGASVRAYAGGQVVRFRDQVILRAQVTHLGRPWPEFKKRIQIPNWWIDVHRRALRDGLTPRFIGVYHFRELTIFVDFDPSTYVRRKANNSAAHVATNDLFQAETLGQFSREDNNGNRLTSIRFDELANYLLAGFTPDPHVDIFARFNAEFLTGTDLAALGAVKEMFAADWPDAFQGEWPGFYVEYRFDEFLQRGQHYNLVQFQKAKGKGVYDYDLVFRNGGALLFYGDLKSSDITRRESPGNDADDLTRCLREYGRFWYVLYEHETDHAREHGDVATVAWNDWKRSVGYRSRKEYDPLSYSRRFKQTVRYVSMKILELHPANSHLVLREFRQGAQPGGAARALKVMINKKNIDNFLVYSEATDSR